MNQQNKEENEEGRKKGRKGSHPCLVLAHQNSMNCFIVIVFFIFFGS
jgi:hypothetical protein